MLTRCPQCETTFRVTREQLKARQGRVRCGACQAVFDALDTLIEAAVVTAAATPTAVAVAVPEQKVASQAPAVADALPVGSIRPEPAAAAPIATELPAPPSFESVAVEPEPMVVQASPAEPAPYGPVVEPMPEPTAELVPEPVAVEALLTEPDAVGPAAEPMPESGAVTAPAAEQGLALELEPLSHEAPHRHTWLGVLGILAAVVALAAQAAIHFRTEIVVLYPETKPILVRTCAMLGCELALPRKSNLVGIEASDLSPDAAGTLILAATLKNRAPFVQEFPHLELTLTDTADRPLVRRVLAPADYLLPQTPVAAGFGANAELAVNLVVEAAGISAVGYRLYLFYP